MATGSKRPSTEMEGGPSAKRPALLIPTLDIGPVASEEDLDIKVLKARKHQYNYMSYIATCISLFFINLITTAQYIQVQNKKLGERLRERNRFRDTLQGKVVSLEAERDRHAR